MDARGGGAALPANRAVFVDKDGTLVVDVPYNVDPALLRFTPGAVAGLAMLAHAGYRIVVVSNQPGVALGRFDMAALDRLQLALTQRLQAEGIVLDGFYACPHAPAGAGTEGCACRKPQAGMLHSAAAALGIDLKRSWMVGDILDDVEAGHRAGCRSVLLDVGNETVWLEGPGRTPDHLATDLLDAARVIIASDGGSDGDGHGNGDGDVDSDNAAAAHTPRRTTCPA